MNFLKGSINKGAEIRPQKLEKIKIMKASERLETTLANIEIQRQILHFDIDDLNEVLEKVKKLEKENENLKSRVLNLKFGSDIKNF